MHRVLSRYRVAKLAWLDRGTVRVIHRYEHENPGDLVHVDIRKRGRIPDGGGHRDLGRAAGLQNKTGTPSKPQAQLPLSPCRAFAQALGPDIKPKRTRPYRPQTNGKVERFNRTMLEERAYARPYGSEAERVTAFPDWLHGSNHHRAHTSLKGQPPANRVTNLRGQ